MVVIHLLLKHRLKQHHPRDTEVENEKEKFPVCHTLSSTSLPARMSQQLWQWKSVVPLYSEILSLTNFMHGSYRPLCEKKMVVILKESIALLLSLQVLQKQSSKDISEYWE